MKEQLRKIVRETMREAVLSEMKSVNEAFPNINEAFGNDRQMKILHTILKDTKFMDASDFNSFFKKLQKDSSNYFKGETFSLKKLHKDYKTNPKGFKYDDNKYRLAESVVTEGASKEAMGIAGFTGTRGDAVQSFIDKHELDGVKLFKSIKSANLQGRLNFVSALVGKDGNPNQKLTIKLHKKNFNEVVVNETKFIAFWNNKQHEIDGKDLWDAKQKAITMLKVPKSKVGLLAVVSAESQKRQDFRFN